MILRFPFYLPVLSNGHEMGYEGRDVLLQSIRISTADVHAAAADDSSEGLGAPWTDRILISLG